VLNFCAIYKLYTVSVLRPECEKLQMAITQQRVIRYFVCGSWLVFFKARIALFNITVLLTSGLLLREALDRLCVRLNMSVSINGFMATHVSLVSGTAVWTLEHGTGQAADQSGWTT